MIRIVKLFFILSTLIIVNFSTFLVYSRKFEPVSSGSMPGVTFNLIASLGIFELIAFTVYSLMIAMYGAVIDAKSIYPIFIAPKLLIMIVYLVFLLFVSYLTIINEADWDNFTLIELLFPFIGTFYYVILIFKNFLSSSKISKKDTKDKEKDKEDKILCSAIDFSTAIDNLKITSDKGKKLLSKINNDLIPKYNEARDLIKEAKELDNSNSSVHKLEDNLVKLEQKIENEAFHIKDAELEFDRNKLNKKIDLFNKSLE